MMERFLTTALDIYQAQSSNDQGQRSTVALWIDYFDVLMDFSAAKMGNNPKVIHHFIDRIDSDIY